MEREVAGDGRRIFNRPLNRSSHNLHTVSNRPHALARASRIRFSSKSPLSLDMESTFWTAFGASALAALVTSVGIAVIGRFERWGRENTIQRKGWIIMK